MNIFGIHFCADEAMALFAVLTPVVTWLRIRGWKFRFNGKKEE
ncbi:MAG TPA: hypothetical protein VM577_05405 [Anaerovoracaceae bacterium]|nr:hypothetical protein [Anaerovoracaceae bacterium]